MDIIPTLFTLKKSVRVNFSIFKVGSLQSRLTTKVSNIFFLQIILISQTCTINFNVDETRITRKQSEVGRRFYPCITLLWAFLLVPRKIIYLFKTEKAKYTLIENEIVVKNKKNRN